MSRLDENQLSGLTTSEIFSALLPEMLPKTPFDIDADTGVQTPVVTLDDINRPHQHRRLMGIGGFIQPGIQQYRAQHPKPDVGVTHYKDQYGSLTVACGIPDAGSNDERPQQCRQKINHHAGHRP